VIDKTRKARHCSDMPNTKLAMTEGSPPTHSDYKGRCGGAARRRGGVEGLMDSLKVARSGR
jgi:hypothetical protein